jgi:hypothetical protein
MCKVVFHYFTTADNVKLQVDLINANILKVNSLQKGYQ